MTQTPSHWWHNCLPKRICSLPQKVSASSHPGGKEFQSDLLWCVPHSPFSLIYHDSFSSNGHTRQFIYTSVPLPIFFCQPSVEILLTFQGLVQIAFLWDSFFNPESQNMLFLPLHPRSHCLCLRSIIVTCVVYMLLKWDRLGIESWLCPLPAMWLLEYHESLSFLVLQKVKPKPTLPYSIVQTEWDHISLGEKNCGRAEGVWVSQCCIPGVVNISHPTRWQTLGQRHSHPSWDSLASSKTMSCA